MATSSSALSSRKIGTLENNVLWIDRDTYWLSTAPQKSALWDHYHRYRVTAHNFGTAVNHNRFENPDELADHISGIKKHVFSERSLRSMKIGNDQEPDARDYYCRTRGLVVEELGLAVPKWDLRIGASVDGEVINSDGSSDGIIEIKCVEKMYAPLLKYLDEVSEGIEHPREYHRHIWNTHYDQMQGNMAILHKKWCDYIVYCYPEQRIFIQRIDANVQYWETFLYPGLQNFIKNLLDQRLDSDALETNRTIAAPNIHQPTKTEEIEEATKEEIPSS